MKRGSVQTREKLRHGFHKRPLAYYIPATNQLNDKDKKLVAKTLVKITNAVQAKALVVKGGKWGFSMAASLDTPRMGILSYKGVEISVFFKRYTTMVVPDAMDPVPEGALENQDDVWKRFDLFGWSIHKIHKSVREEVTSQEIENQLQSVELSALQKKITSLETENKSLRTQLTPKKKGKK
jgi:hypothetical protein